MQHNEDRERLRRSVYYAVGFIFIIWTVKAIEQGLDSDFSYLGILPRTLQGSVGIFTSPLIHGDVYHLISNSFPLLVLGVGLLYFYPRIGLQVIALIYIMTGFWVWVAARQALHIGASGIVYGMFAFLFLGGFIRGDRRTLAISFILIVLYGGSMFSGLIPTSEGISWESHLMGFMAGAFCAVYFRNEPIVFGAGEDVVANEPEKDNEEEIHFTSGKDTTFTYTFKPRQQRDDPNIPK